VPPKKKNYKTAPKFCNGDSFGPQGKRKKHVAPHLGCHISVDRAKIGLGGPKLPHVQNLGAVL